MFEFRKGAMRYVPIATLAFSSDLSLLLLSSNTETIHIYKLGDQTDKSQQPFVESSENIPEGNHSTWT